MNVVILHEIGWIFSSVITTGATLNSCFLLSLLGVVYRTLSY